MRRLTLTDSPPSGYKRIAVWAALAGARGARSSVWHGRVIRLLILCSVGASLSLNASGEQLPGPPMGPLVVSSLNPRFLAEPSGRAIYLTGSHTWNNLVDMDAVYPPRAFDFNAYLDFLQAHNHNFIRLWAWEVPRPDDVNRYPRRRYAWPQPWIRSDVGADVTGRPRFDLSKFDESYFRRLRERVIAARQRRIYVSIMLFEGWAVQFSPGRLSHPLHASNNINGTPVLGDLRDIHTLRYPELTRLQRRYVEEVIDSVNDLDNVLFEIANEAGPYSTEWQHAMVRFVQSYESTKPHRHPVGMTYQHPGGSNVTLFDSAADWVSPGPEPGDYLTHPEAATGRKVVLVDTDHLGGSGFEDVAWVWRSFFRGSNVLYMDRYVGQDAVTDQQTAAAAEIRASMGYVRLLADHLDIGKMVPAPERASTGYALRGYDFIVVFAPDSAAFSVDLRPNPGILRVEWFDVGAGQISRADDVRGGATVVLQSSSRRGAVAYIRSVSSPASLDMLRNRMLSIRRAALDYAPLTTQVRMITRPYLDRLTSSRSTTAIVVSVFLLGAIEIGFRGSRTLLRRRGARSEPHLVPSARHDRRVHVDHAGGAGDAGEIR